MADKFKRQNTTLDSPLTNGFPITKNDSTVFAQPTRGLWVGGAGNVKVMMADKGNANTVVTLEGVPAGTMLPLRVQRVYSGNTTATLLVGFY